MKRITIIIAIVILLFQGVGICSDANLSKAWKYYLKSDYTNTIKLCRSISGPSKSGQEARYLMGLSFLKLGKPEEARDNFNFLLNNYPNSHMTQELLLAAADSFYLDGEFESAESAYKRLLKNFKNGDYNTFCYLRLGVSLRKQGKWDEAERYFYRIVKDYPTSLEISDAKKFLKKDKFFTVQAGAFSKKGNALKFAETLKRKDYYTSLEKVYDKDNILYKVKTGKFSTKVMADNEVLRLERDGFSARIIS